MYVIGSHNKNAVISTFVES